MSIELTIKYSDAEYKSALREQLTVMPNKHLHTYLPTGILIFVGVVFFYFNVLFSWWGISLITLLSIYAIPCLFADFLMPSIALAFAKKEKLQDTYHFTINKEQIERSSGQGKLNTKWEDLTSVDFFPQNIFFNLEEGVISIPKSRLTDAEIEKLRIYAKRT
ncbi:hypothetical protein CWB72_12695 [Pseudoalteromonas phenolica]|uniref:hypothetical protein n=1 Tax=Pseudoalteromonas phenolica TaxID=161398 RepID=UPI00110AA74E|nr:hypothetical protein [Pseudoalteromonas phenolica]TMN88596.1 hypothetical protein CWB72_12695 [Pseudoalteromonas phenolica]